MPTDVVMPQMGESIFEGTITKWLKKAGDPVEKDEPLFEISTDKVDAEIPSPVAGVLTEIKAPVGATVEVNAVVAVIGEAAGVQRASSEAGETGSSLGETSGKDTAGAKAPHSLSGTYGTTELPPHRRRPVDGDPCEVVPKKETGVDREVHTTAGREAGATVAWWHYRFIRSGSEKPVGGD